MQQNPDMAQLIRMAQSPAGQELLSILQRSGGKQLHSAMAKAAEGDYEDAKKTLSLLLQDPKMRQLLEQMGGQP